MGVASFAPDLDHLNVLCLCGAILVLAPVNLKSLKAMALHLFVSAATKMVPAEGVHRHTHTHTDTHTHTETDRHTHTHRDTHIDTHTHRHIHTHTQRERHTHTQTDTDTHTHTQTMTTPKFALWLHQLSDLAAVSPDGAVNQQTDSVVVLSPEQRRDVVDELKRQEVCAVECQGNLWNKRHTQDQSQLLSSSSREHTHTHILLPHPLPIYSHFYTCAVGKG